MYLLSKRKSSFIGKNHSKLILTDITTVVFIEVNVHIEVIVKDAHQRSNVVMDVRNVMTTALIIRKRYVRRKTRNLTVVIVAHYVIYLAH